MAARRSMSTLVVLASVCLCALAGCGSTNATSSNLPDGARLVQVISAFTGEHRIAAVTVTDPSTTRRISGWINRMRPVPNGPTNCPDLTAVEPGVTLTFRAYARGPVLAKATETDFGFGSYACNPLTVTVPGSRSRSLVAGQFLERLQRLLSVNFGFGEGAIKGKIYLAGGPAPSIMKPLAGHVTLYRTHQPPQVGSTPIASATLPRPAEFKFSGLGPGVYFLRASVKGAPSRCHQTSVTVRVGKTAHASIPWGCGIW